MMAPGRPQAERHRPSGAAHVVLARPRQDEDKGLAMRRLTETAKLIVRLMPKRKGGVPLHEETAGRKKKEETKFAEV